MVLGARPWMLPVATLVGVLLAAALAWLYGGLHREPPSVPRAALGTIVESAPCARPGARDTVVFVVDGWSYRLPLQACGNPQGIRIDVELVRTPDGEPAARLAGAGPAPRNVAADRVGSLLLALAGLSGALLAVLVLRTP